MTTTESTLERIGSYRVVRRVASGATGDVLLAKTDGPLGSERTVILKIFPSGGEELERTFARDATSYSQLSLGTIVRLVDFFALPKDTPDGRGGQLCMVLEHVDGPSLVRLRTLLKSASLELDDRAAIHLAASVFEALAAAHAVNPPLLHRDVNPSNVLIAWDGQVKVTDFGVARQTGSNHAHATASAKGTYGYLAPEQVRGEESTLRADVYSAGIILWELLTKRRAFQRGALPEDEALRAMAEPRLPALDGLRPELPAAVREVVRRALEPRVDQRTLTAEEAATILGASIVIDEARQQLMGALSAVRANAESHPSLPPRASISPERKIVSSIPAPPATKRGVAPPSSDDVAALDSSEVLSVEDYEVARRPPPTPRRSLVDLGPVKGTSATARLAFALPDAPPLSRQSTAGMAAAGQRPGMGQLPPAPPPMAAEPADSELPTQPLNRTLPLQQQPFGGPLEGRVATRSSPPLALPSQLPGPTNGARIPSAPVQAEAPRVPSMRVSSTSARPVAVAPKPAGRGIPVLITVAIVGLGAIAAYLRSQPKPAPTVEATHEAAPPTTESGAPAELPIAKAVETRTTGLEAIPSATASNSSAPSIPVPSASTREAVATSAPTTAQSSAPPAEAPSEEGALAPDMGRIRTAGSIAGRRIFVDDKTVGQTPASIVVRCGRHTVRLGSSGKPQTLDVPCGGNVSVSGR